MAVAEIEERAGVGDGEVDGGAFGDFVEVHVAAEAAGVSGWWRSAGGAGGGGDAAEHGMDGDGDVLEVFGRRVGSGGAFGKVKMPADGFAVVAGLDGEVGREGGLDDGIVAAGVVAVEAEAVEMDDEGVAGHGSLNVEGAGFGVASGGAADAVFVYAAGVDGCGLDGVAGVDGEDRVYRAQRIGGRRW